jgi:amino acid permease
MHILPGIYGFFLLYEKWWLEKSRGFLVQYHFNMIMNLTMPSTFIENQGVNNWFNENISVHNDGWEMQVFTEFNNVLQSNDSALMK